MSDPTVTPAAQNRALAEQVYDMIMADIEPDLLLQNIPTLDAQYAGESPEQHESRLQRYAVSYKKFDLALAEFMADVNGNVRSTQRAALREKEEEAKAEEQNALTSLASAFA